jgi:acetylornithine/N-succinyldiaminopimelate aminotransferase
MELFEVYSLFDVTPVKAAGCWITDANGRQYLDLYGGHAVISIGHSHPHFVNRISDQLGRMAFYSNSVQNPLQQELADALGRASGLESYHLFLCNSGAEANENALKLASFHTGKSRVIAFENGFHGRTSAAVAATDNPSIISALNAQQQVTFLPLNQISALENELEKGDVCAVILESIQGVGGLDMATPSFLEQASQCCRKYGAVLIADEVQSGFGRSGSFFAFQKTQVMPGIISMAKGMGNGFPVGGILIHPEFKPSYGLLGTTFGGNHLACTASLAVLEILESEDLLANTREIEVYFRDKAAILPGLRQVKGSGLMLGLEFEFEVAELRKRLIYEYGIFTGSSRNRNLLRILPPLNIRKEELVIFFEALENALS